VCLPFAARFSDYPCIRNVPGEFFETRVQSAGSATWHAIRLSFSHMGVFAPAFRAARRCNDGPQAAAR
jgi:hypothetical protein